MRGIEPEKPLRLYAAVREGGQVSNAEHYYARPEAFATTGFENLLLDDIHYPAKEETNPIAETSPACLAH